MSRIAITIKARLDSRRKLLIPYLVAGDPNLDTSLSLMHALVAAGADIIELGVPFSDPSSDGAVIQKGAERALAAGTSLGDVITLVARFRQTDKATPVVLMGYLNPVEIMGYANFVERAAAAGVDGVLIVDMPPTESQRLKEAMTAAEMDLVFLVAPTTSPERARLIVKQCTGYLYYVSLKGVTGAAIKDSDSIRRNVEYLRSLSDIAIVIGFGIKDADSAASMASLADGVVIGSALVQRIAELAGQAVTDAATLDSTVALIATARQRLDDEVVKSGK